uniref:Uncharacterized protein n=1 Tax=Tanacetum cinerariifolium TaxID=118510 RepID=A0A6L2LTE2_TANCI|nr:hypothetical protein [Tanacetum cinerariifolium]
MLESKAYKTYYAFAYGEKTSKPNYVQKKPDSDTFPKQKPGQATKAKQLKLATKRSKKDFYISHVSGSGDGVETQSKVPDEQQQKTSGTNEGTGDSDEEDDDENDFEEKADINDDVNNENDESDDERMESNSDVIPYPNQTNVDQTEHEEEDVDERVQTPSDYELTNDENIHDEENVDEEEEDEVTKDLYDDVNVNLGNEDTKMTYADQGASEQQNASHQSGFEQEEEDSHVTLTPVLDTQKTRGPTQSSSVSFDFTSKLLNLDNPSPTNNEIASLMDTTAYHAIKILEITSKIKKVDQYAQALSSIPAIVDHYMDNKLREAINKAIQAHNFDYREKAQTKKREYIELVDSTVKTIKEVNAQLPQILSQVISDVATPVIKKNVTESLETAVLTRSSSQPQSSYEAAVTLSEFELTKILIDKMEKNKSFDVADYKRELYNALVKSYNNDKDIFESYGEVFSLKMSRDKRDKDQDPSARSNRGTKRRKSSKDAESSRDSRSKEKKSSSTSKDASQSRHKFSNKSAHAEEPSHNVKDSGKQQDQEFITGDYDE